MRNFKADAATTTDLTDAHIYGPWDPKLPSERRWRFHTHLWRSRVSDAMDAFAERTGISLPRKFEAGGLWYGWGQEDQTQSRMTEVIRIHKRMISWLAMINQGEHPNICWMLSEPKTKLSNRSQGSPWRWIQLWRALEHFRHPHHLESWLKRCRWAADTKLRPFGLRMDRVSLNQAMAWMGKGKPGRAGIFAAALTCVRRSAGYKVQILAACHIQSRRRWALWVLEQSANDGDRLRGRGDDSEFLVDPWLEEEREAAVQRRANRIEETQSEEKPWAECIEPVGHSLNLVFESAS